MRGEAYSGAPPPAIANRAEGLSEGCPGKAVKQPGQHPDHAGRRVAGPGRRNGVIVNAAYGLAGQRGGGALISDKRLYYTTNIVDAKMPVRQRRTNKINRQQKRGLSPHHADLCAICL